MPVTTLPKISASDTDNLYGLFVQRVKLSGDAVAYHQYDAQQQAWRRYTWREVADAAARWQKALAGEDLQRGDRVAVMLPNSVNWIVFDQAALGLGLVTVPLYSHDSAGNVLHILQDSSTELLVGDPQRLARLDLQDPVLAKLRRIVSIGKDAPAPAVASDDWLLQPAPAELAPVSACSDDVATIVYTSGTLGPPKGVMLTHRNVFVNAVAASERVHVDSDNLFLSFLPLSHMFERTAGYYMSMMMGAQVAFARSVQQLKEDLQTLHPTVLASVPRIYEQMYDRLHAAAAKRGRAGRALLRAAVVVGWRRYRRKGLVDCICTLLWPLFDRLVARDFRHSLGGRLRYAISGGAALSPAIARTLTALGVPVYQGYGLTETSPVVSVNVPGDNVPESIGMPLRGVEVRMGADDELLVRGENVMQGYWNMPEVTARTIDADGWLHTGDQARMDQQGRLYIVGRLKEIIVMGSGEKIPPTNLEHAIAADPLFSQVMVHGEGRAFLVALAVLDEEGAAQYRDGSKADPNGDGATASAALQSEAMKRIGARLAGFPSYARVRRVILLSEPWTIDNGLLTPTLKMKRGMIAKHFHDEIEEAYRGFQAAVSGRGATHVS